MKLSCIYITPSAHFVWVALYRRPRPDHAQAPSGTGHPRPSPGRMQTLRVIAEPFTQRPASWNSSSVTPFSPRSVAAPARSPCEEAGRPSVVSRAAANQCFTIWFTVCGHRWSPRVVAFFARVSGKATRPLRRTSPKTGPVVMPCEARNRSTGAPGNRARSQAVRHGWCATRLGVASAGSPRRARQGRREAAHPCTPRGSSPECGLSAELVHRDLDTDVIDRRAPPPAKVVRSHPNWLRTPLDCSGPAARRGPW